MANVLVTGYGNVGKSTLDFLAEIHNVKLFDLIKHSIPSVECIKGDVRSYKQVLEAIEGCDVVIHTAALLPTHTDAEKWGYHVNVNGTKNIIHACEKNSASLIYTSSIAVYGDRRGTEPILETDPLSPNEPYSEEKAEAEQLILGSGIEHAIFRLSYVVDPVSMVMNPTMFEMPLDTWLELVHTQDVGLALARAVEEDVWGEIYNIAGGETCRIQYGEYLHLVMQSFGLPGNIFEENLFSEEDYHCGMMDTQKSRFLIYQNHDLSDIIEEIDTNHRRHKNLVNFMWTLFPKLTRQIIEKKLYT